MKRFAELYAEIDGSTKTNVKIAALRRYFSVAPAADAAWALAFLIGRRPRRPVTTTKLWQWAMELSELPPWLFSECYDAVADLAETIAKIVPPRTRAASDLPLHVWVQERLLPLAGLPDEEQRTVVVGAWLELDTQERLVFNKLITGEFRVGVAKDLVVKALSQALDLPAQVLAHRLMGAWQPDAAFFQNLASGDHADADVSKPYPFCLAYPLEGDVSTLGDPSEWVVEWKYDGIRGQMIRRQRQSFLWSRGEDLITDRFPELAEAANSLPEGTVIDGEVLAWDGEMPRPFADLQQRIGRKTVTAKLLRGVPVVLVAYDLLESNGRDVRDWPLTDRRRELEKIIVAAGEERLRISALVDHNSWERLARERMRSRELNVEGFMIKRKTSTYQVGRKKGHWWKWKIEPYAVDCVLIYAARGNGIRASLYTDFTFGIWHEGRLVPFAKAYSGLTDEEIREVDAWVRRNTVEKFGPVRTVKPELVFELVFEGIRVSSRHKSGIAVRFPRISRWRKDKSIQDADSLDTVKALLR